MDGDDYLPKEVVKNNEVCNVIFGVSFITLIGVIMYIIIYGG